MVSKHLPVIFTALFNIDNKELMQIASKLDDIVPLYFGLKMGRWKVGPELLEIKPIRRIVPDLLFFPN